MNREFLDFYNRELSLLYEQAGDFAEEYPGIAERLGGLIRDRSDPMITGLLEGAAFLAARVQLKLKHEFPEFTANLLEQLVPNYLAPTPSAMLVTARPPMPTRRYAMARRSRAAPISMPPIARENEVFPADFDFAAISLFGHLTSPAPNTSRRQARCRRSGFPSAATSSLGSGCR